MATLLIPISDEFLPTAIEKIAIGLNYQDEIEDPESDLMIPNPDSKVKTIKEYIYRVLREAYEAGVAIELATTDQATKDQAKIDAEVGIGD